MGSVLNGKKGIVMYLNVCKKYLAPFPPPFSCQVSSKEKIPKFKLSVLWFSLLKFIKAKCCFLLFVSCSQDWFVYPQEEVGVSLGMLASQSESGNKFI